ncbi:hypothetical protein CBR_g8531 [Chara braunii]|uniref:Response regulatory domain-containing protein n=1 Tax=Chara braunii TaxID=69332 RepID=A0A388KME3_CHABU|nr:hypothetical protein CBR_g8531 [Chara braunii]|eukprot:GBG71229.1 hypothetical protein CBR_g8531 [Chara braunii]
MEGSIALKQKPGSGALFAFHIEVGVDNQSDQTSSSSMNAITTSFLQRIRNVKNTQSFRDTGMILAMPNSAVRQATFAWMTRHEVGVQLIDSWQNLMDIVAAGCKRDMQSTCRLEVWEGGGLTQEEVTRASSSIPHSEDHASANMSSSCRHPDHPLSDCEADETSSWDGLPLQNLHVVIVIDIDIVPRTCESSEEDLKGFVELLMPAACLDKSACNDSDTCQGRIGSHAQSVCLIWLVPATIGTQTRHNLQCLGNCTSSVKPQCLVTSHIVSKPFYSSRMLEALEIAAATANSCKHHFTCESHLIADKEIEIIVDGDRGKAATDEDGGRYAKTFARPDISKLVRPGSLQDHELERFACRMNFTDFEFDVLENSGLVINQCDRLAKVLQDGTKGCGLGLKVKGGSEDVLPPGTYAGCTDKRFPADESKGMSSSSTKEVEAAITQFKAEDVEECSRKSVSNSVTACLPHSAEHQVWRARADAQSGMPKPMQHPEDPSLSSSQRARTPPAWLESDMSVKLGIAASTVSNIIPDIAKDCVPPRCSPQATDATTVVTQSHPHSSRQLAGLKILVAEDTPLLRKLEVTSLQRLGAEVVGVEDGKKAVETICEGADGSSKKRFDCVLMDCQSVCGQGGWIWLADPGTAVLTVGSMESGGKYNGGSAVLGCSWMVPLAK